MKQRSKYTQRFFMFPLVGIGVYFALFAFWKVNSLEMLQNSKRLHSEKAQFFEKNNSEIKEIIHSSLVLEVKQDPLKIHQEENADLKEWSLKSSPDGEKVAYYQNKFVNDIKEIGDPDYTSLIVEQNGRKQIVFQGNFHLSHFEWFNNNEIKISKGCGSSCLLNYVVNIHNKKYKELATQVFRFD